MATTAKISFELYDTTAKADSTPSTTDIQSFCDINDLKLDELTAAKYATLEQDLFLLDGNYELFPDSPTGAIRGLWSESMSGSDGAFSSPPVLDISFSSAHSSQGITIRFSELTGDYANSVTVKWYDGSDTIISQSTYTPDSTVWAVEDKVENYRRIELIFNSTNKPYRYLKILEIQYGVLKVFTGDDIVTATVSEEIDALSSEISINTFNFSIHSNDTNLSVLNPQGIFSLIQQGQKVKAAEIVNGSEINMGTFYLEDWENPDANTIKMSAIDAVGRMDKTNFYGGIYSSVLASVIVAAIMLSADADYEFDSSLDIALSGWIPVCTHREALQQVAFAVGAIVDCSRSDKIKIYAAPVPPTSYITYARKWATGQTLKVKQLVTGVDVVSHNYTAGTETSEALNDELEIGTYDITFSNPLHSLSISGATITESNANHAVIEVATAGTVVLSGSLYVDTTKVNRKRMATIPPGASANVLTVDSATLVSSSIASGAANRIYNYYQQRYENTFSMVADTEIVSDIVMVDSIRGEKLKGVIETMDIDLTGGFVAKLKVCGVRIETLNAYYSGTEIYTGELVGVI